MSEATVNKSGYPKWTVLDVISWKTFQCNPFDNTDPIVEYKDGWVVYNQGPIVATAKKWKVPADVVAGIGWEEAGGDPNVVDTFAYELRAGIHDGSFPKFVKSMIKRPEDTSFGIVSMQLALAARAMGKDATVMTRDQVKSIAVCLETDVCNIDLVAQVVRDLILFDSPGWLGEPLTDFQYVLVGSRYNRGTARALADFQASFDAKPGTAGREYTEYGRAMLKRRKRIRRLLNSK